MTVTPEVAAARIAMDFTALRARRRGVHRLRIVAGRAERFTILEALAAAEAVVRAMIRDELRPSAPAVRTANTIRDSRAAIAVASEYLLAECAPHCGGKEPRDDGRTAEHEIRSARRGCRGRSREHTTARAPVRPRGATSVARVSCSDRRRATRVLAAQASARNGTTSPGLSERTRAAPRARARTEPRRPR